MSDLPKYRELSLTQLVKGQIKLDLHIRVIGPVQWLVLRRLKVSSQPSPSIALSELVSGGVCTHSCLHVVRDVARLAFYSCAEASAGDPAPFPFLLLLLFQHVEG